MQVLVLVDNQHETGMLLEMDEPDEEAESDEEEAVVVEGEVESDEGEEAEVDVAYEKLASSGDVASGSDAVLHSHSRYFLCRASTMHDMLCGAVFFPGTSDFVKQFPSVVELLVPSTQEPTC